MGHVHSNSAAAAVAKSNPAASSAGGAANDITPLGSTSAARIAIVRNSFDESSLEELENDDSASGSAALPVPAVSSARVAAGGAGSLTERIRSMMMGANHSPSIATLAHSVTYTYNTDSPVAANSPRGGEPPHSPVDLPSILASAASFTSNDAPSLVGTPDDRSQLHGAALTAMLAKRQLGISSSAASGVDCGAENVGDVDTDPEAVAAVAAAMRSVLLPTVFHWGGGGREVFVTGAFNSWSAKIPLSRSLNDFSLILQMPPGSYEFRYIVDDAWRYNPNETVISDTYGNVSNLLIVEPPRAAVLEALQRARRDSVGSTPTTATASSRRRARYSVTDEQQLHAALNICFDDTSFSIHENVVGGNVGDGAASAFEPDHDWGQKVPDSSDAWAKEPPQLPPHIGSLQQLPLNSEPVNDPYLLPKPLSVSLHHLFCASNKRDAIRVLALTERHNKKTVTTVFYTPSAR